MGRLIEEDALINKLKRTSVFECVRNAADQNIFEIIAEQPTAYNLEKVISDLEKLKEHYRTWCACDYNDGARAAISEALAIVRRGQV